MELYISPEKKQEMKVATRGTKEEAERLYKLTEIVRQIKEDLEETGLPEWEVSLKGYIEASSGGVLPGGKAGFEATITISSPKA
ncbi:MAG TPA: hypothetical protein VIO58_07635 [Candidatus Methanoperedens sp.]